MFRLSYVKNVCLFFVFFFVGLQLMLFCCRLLIVWVEFVHYAFVIDGVRFLFVNVVASLVTSSEAKIGLFSIQIERIVVF